MRFLSTLSLLVIGFGLIAFTGCTEPDVTPPAAPQAVTTVNGNGAVDIFWVRNSESDLAGYRIYTSSSYSGGYVPLGTTRSAEYHDGTALNGQTRYYAVSAYDNAGNESELSVELAAATPRPDGRGIVLPNYASDPNHAGYDFSTYSIGPYDDQYTDVFFEASPTRPYLVVWTDSDIQDMGYTSSLDEIVSAPDSGWSPTKDAPVIAGHTYVIWTWDDHYAKVRVTQSSLSSLRFDWAYQLQSGNHRLKSSPERGTLRAGTGFLSRRE